LKISNGLWKWWSRDIGGRSALDYLIKVRGMDFMDAVQTILGQMGLQGLQDAPRPKANAKANDKAARALPAEEKKHRTLLLPKAHTDNAAVLDYLARRGIDAGIAEDAARAGVVYENRYRNPNTGREYANAVFIGNDMDGEPRFATIRGIGTPYKTEAAGSDKRYSFAMPAQGGATTLRLFESAIDLLSWATLCKLRGRDPCEQHQLSLAGVYRPRENVAESNIPAAFTRFAEDHPGVETVVLHLDNDLAGRKASEALRVMLADGYKVIDRPPPQDCKDVNDYLVRIRREHGERQAIER
jgi:hypothetical protein